MKAHHFLFIIAFVAGALMLSGCSFFGADDGAIRGVVFYADGETVVPEPWVAVYEITTPEVVSYLLHGDEGGRYSVFVPEGLYIALGSTDQAGPFTGIDTQFSVLDTVTTVKKIVIDEDAP